MKSDLFPSFVITLRFHVPFVVVVSVVVMVAVPLSVFTFVIAGGVSVVLSVTHTPFSI